MPDQTYASRGVVDLIVPSAARTSSGTTSLLTGYGAANVLRARLSVTAAAGTNVDLDVVLEDSLDGGATWTTIGGFARPATGDPAQHVRTESLDVTTPFGPDLRCRWKITGTSPSFTFGVHLLSK